MANVKAYFSCIKPTANKWGRLSDRLATRQVAFVVVNEIAVGQETRILLDLIGGRNDLAWMVERFTELQLDPKVIAAFRTDNAPIDFIHWSTTGTAALSPMEPWRNCTKLLRHI